MCEKLNKMNKYFFRVSLFFFLTLVESHQTIKITKSKKKPFKKNRALLLIDFEDPKFDFQKNLSRSSERKIFRWKMYSHNSTVYKKKKSKESKFDRKFQWLDAFFSKTYSHNFLVFLFVFFFKFCSYIKIFYMNDLLIRCKKSY